MQHTISITLDTDSLTSYTDSHLAALWHVGQANPAPLGDRDAGELAEKIGREIIRRFVSQTPPDLWHHQGNHHYWKALTDHCIHRDGQWMPKAGTPLPATLEGAAPRIGELWPEHGGLYAGIVRGDDGAPDQHLILLPGDQDDLTWDAARSWAASIGGALPTRREQALLYANLKSEFEGRAYWSAEQHASDSDYAWCQTFYDGYQYLNTTDSEFRARAVRRLPIQSFSHSEPAAGVQTSAPATPVIPQPRPER